MAESKGGFNLRPESNRSRFKVLQVITDHRRVCACLPCEPLPACLRVFSFAVLAAVAILQVVPFAGPDSCCMADSHMCSRPKNGSKPGAGRPATANLPQ